MDVFGTAIPVPERTKSVKRFGLSCQPRAILAVLLGKSDAHFGGCLTSHERAGQTMDGARLRLLGKPVSVAQSLDQAHHVRHGLCSELAHHATALRFDGSLRRS